MGISHENFRVSDYTCGALIKLDGQIGFKPARCSQGRWIDISLPRLNASGPLATARGDARRLPSGLEGNAGDVLPRDEHSTANNWAKDFMKNMRR